MKNSRHDKNSENARNFLYLFFQEEEL